MDKKQYNEIITDLLQQCNDTNLLDLIMKLLLKSV